MQISLYQIAQLIIILVFSLILSIQDIKKQKVSLYLLWLSLIIAFICQLIIFRLDVWIYLFSSVLMGLYYFLVRKISKNRLGLADVLFGFFQGLFLTPLMIPLCFGLESVAALIIRRKTRQQRFAFIPYMAFGLISTFLIQIFIV